MRDFGSECPFVGSVSSKSNVDVGAPLQERRCKTEDLDMHSSGWSLRETSLDEESEEKRMARVNLSLRDSSRCSSWLVQGAGEDALESARSGPIIGGEGSPCLIFNTYSTLQSPFTHISLMLS